MGAADQSPLRPSPVPPDILDEAETLPGALARLVERFPDHECLVMLDRVRGETRTRLRDFWADAKSVQQALQSRGVRHGDAVLLSFPTGPELVAGYFGVMLAGGVPAVIATPSNRVADADVYRNHVSDILENASARLFYCDDPVADLFTDEDGSVRCEAGLLRSRELEPCASLPESVPVAPGDFATIQYSSGSTGKPKGVLLEHRAMLDHIRSVREGLRIDSSDVSVNWIPLYHDMGLIDAFLLPLLSGCPTILIPTMDFLRQPLLWLEAIHRYRGTLSWSPNFGYSLCSKRIEDEEIDALDLSSWRLALSAAEPVLAETLDAFCGRFARAGFAPEAMTPAWGLAESGTIVTSHLREELPRVEYIDRNRLGSCGRAEPVPPDAPGAMSSVGVGRCLPRARFEIRDERNAVLGDRQLGEIWIQTDCLFTRYNEDPELTARTLVDGWFDTGDQGYRADDQLFFVSRSKDLIVVGGEKYAPHDVEAAINEVPGVRAGCAVAFGVINRDSGTEELGAVVETRLEQPDERAELARAIRQRVTQTVGLGVRHLHLVPPGGIDKTTSGKLARRSTRARYPEVFGDDSGS